MNTFFASVALLCVALVGCTSSSVDPTEVFFVRATVNGEKFEASTYEAFKRADTIFIEAHAGDNLPDIQLKLAGIEYRDYNLGRDLYNEASYSLHPNADPYWVRFKQGEGEVHITRLTDDEVDGTFWFRGTNASFDTVSVQSGRFHVRLS